VYSAVCLGTIGKNESMRIPYDELFDGLLGVLLKLNFEQQRARLCARLFADASRTESIRHGLNRFRNSCECSKMESLRLMPSLSWWTSLGSLERWDGKRGPAT